MHRGDPGETRRPFPGRGTGRPLQCPSGVEVAGSFGLNDAAPLDGAAGEVHDVELFVMVLGASNYTYADATRTQQTADFIVATNGRTLGGRPSAHGSVPSGGSDRRTTFTDPSAICISEVGDLPLPRLSKRSIRGGLTGYRGQPVSPNGDESPRPRYGADPIPRPIR